MKVTAVIVSYNTVDPLRRCLQSLSEVDAVIVVDNASHDGSAEMVRSEFPAVRLIVNLQNVGFGQACNQGIAQATGDAVLLLNSDATALPGAIPTLSACLEDPAVVACGGRLIDSGSAEVFDEHAFRNRLTEGRGMPPTEDEFRLMLTAAQRVCTQNSCCSRLTLWAVVCEQSGLEKLFPNSRVLSPYWTTQRLLASPGPHEVAQVMGACLLFRPVERFDERFFLYCEDTELCHRLLRHGRIVYVPAAVFTHELGSSSTQTRWSSVAWYNRGKELYFKIHHGALASAVCCILNRLGAALRVVTFGALSLLTLGRMKSAVTKAVLFSRVLLCPVSGPPDPRHARPSDS